MPLQATSPPPSRSWPEPKPATSPERRSASTEASPSESQGSLAATAAQPLNRPNSGPVAQDGSVSSQDVGERVPTPSPTLYPRSAAPLPCPCASPCPSC